MEDGLRVGSTARMMMMKRSRLVGNKVEKRIIQISQLTKNRGKGVKVVA
jgi:hypothetical protein